MKGRVQANLILLFTLILVFFVYFHAFAAIESGGKEGLSRNAGSKISDPFGSFKGDDLLESFELNHPLVDLYIKSLSKKRWWMDDFNERMERLDRYEDMIKSIFRNAGIPEDLIYVSFVESGGNTKLKGGRGNPAGLWQLVPSTARELGLTVNKRIDERLDPFKSTFAVARYFSDLYEKFHSWSLVLAAYNMGEYALLNKLQRYGSTDFFELVRNKRIPKQTRNYVLKVYASMRLGRKMEVDVKESANYLRVQNTWSVLIPENITVEELAEVLGVPASVLLRLNANIPSPDMVLRKGCFINIPLEGKGRFVNLMGYAGSRY